MHNTLNISEILKYIQFEAKNLQIDFLIHYGLRYFSPHGISIGETTNQEWNRFINDNSKLDAVKNHYLYYLKLMGQKNIRYQIRRKEDANTPFLKHLVDADMCNSLTIFTKDAYGIKTYFFVADPRNHDANFLFYNNFPAFEKIVNLVEKKITQKFIWETVNSSGSNKLFSLHETTLLFKGNKQMKPDKKLFYLDGIECALSQKEIDALMYIKNGYTLKKMADFMELSIRGVEHRLLNIRRHFNISSKHELVVFANKLYEVL